MEGFVLANEGEADQRHGCAGGKGLFGGDF